MKNKQKPIDTMRLLRRICRLAVILVCLPLTALAMIMVYCYVDEVASIFYLVTVIFAPITYILLRDIIIEIAKFVWMLTDDESI